MLPTEKQQDWILCELRTLLGRFGLSRFLGGRVLLPTPTDFPRLWTADLRSCRDLVRTLLDAAGLQRIGVRISSFHEVRTEGHTQGSSEFHNGTAAWFAGIDAGGRAIFGVEESLLAEPIPVVGAMAHEVAHAFRRIEKIETTPVEVEESRTDLTTVFLGFGVLTANAAYLYRTTHETDGLHISRRTQYWSGGYLSDIELAYALGLQMELRQRPREANLVAEHLEVNQRASYNSARRRVRRERPAVLGSLGLNEDDMPHQSSRFAEAIRGIASWLAGHLGIQTLRERSRIEAHEAIRKALSGAPPPEA